MANQNLMYSEFAKWWHQISSPEEYAEEAEFFYQTLIENSNKPPLTLLELGSGGGNNASYLKKHFQMTLVDLSADMIAESKKINPELEHFHGDMRTFRSGKIYDAVFIHDAIMYMTTESDLHKALETAAIHCKPGGIALFAPDEVKEIFEPFTDCGGNDHPEGQGIRYLEWSYDPDPSDTTYVMDFAYMVRGKDGEVELAHDRHIIGLFPRQVWLHLMKKVGFEPIIVPDPFSRELFVGRRIED